MISGEGEAHPVNVPLSADGKATWVDFYDRHGREQAELAGDLAATWSKLEGYAARLALVIHFVRWAVDDPSLATVSEIDAKSIEAGVSLSRWFGNEARRVYAILGESDEQRDRRRLVELIQRKDGSVTVRNLMRCTQMFAKAEIAEQALNDLSEAMPDGKGGWQSVPALLTEEEAIRFLRLDAEGNPDPVQTLARYRNTGQLVAIKVGRWNRYRRQDMEDFLARKSDQKQRTTAH
jgi:hypothetical protein